MADDAAKAVRFHRRHFLQHILNHRPANRDEGVAVVETERGEFVALAADVQRLAQGQFAGAGGLVGRRCSVAGGAAAPPYRLRRRFALILLSVETPSLLR